MPQGRARPSRPSDLSTSRDVLQAWADGRITWWEVMWWSEDGSFAAIAAAARKAGVTWMPPQTGSQAGQGRDVPLDPKYESHVAGWANHQANLLLRHLAGDPHAANQIDWANVADEIADVADCLVENGELHLARALAYVAKLAAEPSHPATDHWHEAAVGHFHDAQLWLNRPDLRALADLDSVWFQARRIARFDLGLDTWHTSWPDELPFSLGDLLAEGLDPTLLANQLRKFAAESDGHQA